MLVAGTDGVPRKYWRLSPPHEHLAFARGHRLVLLTLQGNGFASSRSAVLLFFPLVDRLKSATSSRPFSTAPSRRRRFSGGRRSCRAPSCSRRRGPPEMLLQEGNVLEEELFLQVLGAGRNHHALAGEDGGHQIRQRLAGACAGLDDRVQQCVKAMFIV